MLIHLLFLQSLAAPAPQCIGNNIRVDDSNWQNYINKGVPVIIRMVFTGCVYAKPTQQVWTDAAKLYDDVLFLEADCINGAAKLCNKLQIEIGKKEQLTSPSIFFYKTTGSPTDKDLIKYAIEPEVEFFTEEIRIRFDKHPLGKPVRRLDTYSTTSFLNTSDISTILFYSSSDYKNMSFISRPIDAVNNEILDSSLFSVGALDCCRYPEECKRWTGLENPGLMSLVYSKTTSRSLVPHKVEDNLDTYAKSVLSAADLVVNAPTPQKTPYPVKPGESQRPGFNTATKTIRSKLQSRSKSDVMKMYKEYDGYDDLNPVKYNLNPIECKTGSFDEGARNKAFKALNFFRQVAGVEPVKEQKADFKTGLDALTVVLGRENKVSHNPSGFKCLNQASVSADIVNEYAKSSNLGLGAESPHKAVENLIRDWGESNAEVGHRYNMLHPAYNKSANAGFWIGGQRTSGDSSYFPGFSAVLLESTSIKADEPWYPDLPEFVAYPAPGPFPLQFGQLTERWSVQTPLLDNVENTDDIEVKMIGSDNSAIEVTKVTLNKGYGKTYRLIAFEISSRHLQLFVDGYSVEVQVFFKSTKTELRYTVEFFDASVSEGESYCVYKSGSGSCPSSSKSISINDLSSTKFTGDVSLFSTDKSSQLNLPEGVYNVTITGSFSILVVPVNVNAKVLDAEDATVYIDYSPTKVPLFGKAEFIKPPSNIVIRFTTEPELAESFVSSTVYQGPLSKVYFPSQTVYQFPDGNLDLSFEFYSTSTVPNELNVKRYYTSYIAKFCDSDLGTVYTGEQQLSSSFYDGGLVGVKLSKRVHTIQLRSMFNRGTETPIISLNRFPPGKYNYIFEVFNPANSITVVYQLQYTGEEMDEYDSKIKSITFQNYYKDKQLDVGFTSTDPYTVAPRVFPMKFIFKNCKFTPKTIANSWKNIYLLDYEVDPDQVNNLRGNFYDQGSVRPQDCKYVIKPQVSQRLTVYIDQRCAVGGTINLDIVGGVRINILPQDISSADITINVKFTTDSPVPVGFYGFSNLVWNVDQFVPKLIHEYEICNVRNINLKYKTKPLELRYTMNLKTTQLGISIADDPSYKVDMSTNDVSITDSLGKTPTITGVKAKSFTIENVDKCTLENVEVTSIKSTGSDLEIKNSDLTQTDIVVMKDGFEFPTIRAVGSKPPKTLKIYYSGAPSEFNYLESGKIVYKAVTDIDTDIEGWLGKTTLEGVPTSISQQKSKVGKDIVFELTFKGVENPPAVTADPNYSEEVLPEPEDEDSKSGGLSGGAIAGIIFAVLLAIGAVSGGVLYVLKYIKPSLEGVSNTTPEPTQECPEENSEPIV